MGVTNEMSPNNKNEKEQIHKEKKNETANEKRVRVGLITNDIHADKWWIPLIENSPIFVFVAIWTKEKFMAEKLLSNALKNKGVEIFFEDNEENQCCDKNEYKNLKNNKNVFKNHNLESLIQRTDIDAFFIILPPEVHGDVAMRILEEGNKHIFSVNRATEDKLKMSLLVKSYINCRNKAIQTLILNKSISSFPVPFIPVWTFNESVRYESAFHRAKAMLSDIGQVVGGQLNATMLPDWVQYPYQAFVHEVPGNSENFLTAACMSYSALLRSFFGEIKSINAISSASKEESNEDTLAGCLIFDSNVSVSITLTYATTKNNYFHFSIWGTYGNIKIFWIPQENVYEVHRYMHHYEHPTQHSPKGIKFCVQSWINAIFEGKQDMNSPTQALIDLTMAKSMIESNGVDIVVKE